MRHLEFEITDNTRLMQEEDELNELLLTVSKKVEEIKKDRRERARRQTELLQQQRQLLEYWERVEGLAKGEDNAERLHSDGE